MNRNNLYAVIFILASATARSQTPATNAFTAATQQHMDELTWSDETVRQAVRAYESAANELAKTEPSQQTFVSFLNAYAVLNFQAAGDDGKSASDGLKIKRSLLTPLTKKQNWKTSVDQVVATSVDNLQNKTSSFVVDKAGPGEDVVTAALQYAYGTDAIVALQDSPSAEVLYSLILSNFKIEWQDKSGGTYYVFRDTGLQNKPNFTKATQQFLKLGLKQSRDYVQFLKSGHM